MNMVLPQWLFIDRNADTLISHLERGTFNLLDSSQAKIVPMLSNVDTGYYDSCIIRIISSETKRKVFINSLLTYLKKYGMDGLNIDFENLDDFNDNKQLTELLLGFHKELYDSLHAHHYLATQCVRPFSTDYNISELHNFNDYIFVMAYDEHLMNRPPVLSAQQNGWRML